MRFGIDQFHQLLDEIVLGWRPEALTQGKRELSETKHTKSQ
jgi:hypothetical protein